MISSFIQKSIFSFIVASCLFFIILTANVRAETGNQLLQRCEAATAILAKKSTDANFWDGAFCLGYIWGIAESSAVFDVADNKFIMFCSPAGSTSGQAQKIVVKYLEDHPEELHKEAAVLVAKALQRAFPCRKTKR